ncbi:MAG: hypothetical protein ABL995_19080 [Bryobacteraceae bacterium]
MKKIMLGFALGALLLVVSAPVSAQEEKKNRINERKENQKERIEQGKADGSLTDREARRLEAEEAALNAKIRKDRKDGGGMTAQEKKAAERRQDNMSKKIYRQRHDKQTQ